MRMRYLLVLAIACGCKDKGAAPARAPVAAAADAAARVPCGPTSCAPDEYCVATVITGGAAAMAEHERPPSYTCDAKLPDTTSGALECQPPNGRQVSCIANAK